MSDIGAGNKGDGGSGKKDKPSSFWDSLKSIGQGVLEGVGVKPSVRSSGGVKRSVGPRDPLEGERKIAAAQLRRSLKAWRDRDAENRAMRKPEIPTGGGRPMDAGVQSKMQQKLGADLSDVKIHTGGDSAKASEDLNAKAFTVGNDVHFNSGEFDPGSKEGTKLLAHELTHVVQAQKGGVQRKNDDDAGEGAEVDGEELDVSDPDEPAEEEADAVAEDATKDVGDKGVEGEAEGEQGKEGAEAPESKTVAAKLHGVGTKLHRAISINSAAPATISRAAKPKRPDELKGKATPNLDALAEIEGEAVYKRYLGEFATYDANSKASNKQSILIYLEGRAARKLGRSAERESIAAYGAKSGYKGGKSNTTVEIWSDDGKKKLRDRIPDIFDAASVVGDVKMVAEQSLDAQLQDSQLIADGKNCKVDGKPLKGKRRFDVCVSGPSDRYPSGTKVSGPLSAACAATGGAVWEITDA